MPGDITLDLLTIGAAALTTVLVGGLWLHLTNRAVARANAEWAPFSAKRRAAPPTPRLDPDVPPGARTQWDTEPAAP